MKKVYLPALAIIHIVCAFAQEPNSIIEKISAGLSFYQQNQPAEKTYLQTDKDIYEPGEIIWFKAFVFNRSTQKPSILSDELIFHFLDNKGNLIQTDYYHLVKGTTHGDYKIPDGLPRGRYYLAAYPSKLKYTGQIYTQLIYVDKPFMTDLIINDLNPGKIYDAKEEANIRVEVKSLENIPEPKLKINYSLLLGNEEIENGKTRTNETGIASINFRFPEKTGSLPLRIIISEDKNYWEKSIVLKTTHDQITVNFMPEGGIFIKGFPQKLGIIAKDLLGRYIPFTGDIIDSKGNLVSKCQSFAEGFGLVPIQFAEGEKYRFVLTSEYGNKQEFLLPEPTNGKSSLSIINVDENFIHTQIFSQEGNSRKISLTLTSGYHLVWAGELSISGPVRFRVPIQNCPGGIMMLSAFNPENELIGQRLVYINRNNKINIKTEASITNNMAALITTTDENNTLINPGLAVSIAPDYCFFENRQNIFNYLNFNAELENPILDYSFINPEKTINNVAIDYFLIANKLNGFSWDKIINSDTITIDSGPLVEKHLAEYILKLDLQNTETDVSREKRSEFILANKELLSETQKTSSNQARKISEPAYKTLLESSTRLLDVIRTIKPFSLSGDNIVFSGMINSINSGLGAVIVIDGQMLGNSVSVLDNFNPLDIEEINIFTDPVQSQKYTSFASGGLIEIFTKKARDTQSITNISPQENNLYLNGFRIPREYGTVLNLLSLNNESKSTIFWNHNLSGNAGQPTKITIPAPRLKSDFIIQAEGFDNEGRIGSYHTIIKK